jgi:hypothetical protein
MSGRIEARSTIAQGALARRLRLGASALTLAALAGAPALADVTVSGGSAPLATATASSSGAENIVQTGTLSVPSGTAITLNSSNSVTNSGTIQTQNTSDVTGILAEGGNTGSITNSGSIVLNQTSTLTTTDSNGVITGPFATSSNLNGVRVTGSDALNGAIVNSGTITVQGNNSYGISVEAPLAAGIANSGTITLMGSNGAALRTTAAVGGDVATTGTITASGQGAQAVSIGGDVAGRLSLGGSITATGYHTPSRSTTSSTILVDQNTNDIAQGGPAVSVAGSLGGGLLVSAPPTTLSSTVADLNGDGIADSGEVTGVVTSYGGAPAIQIGAVGRDIQLGEVGTGDSAYGVVIEGSVTGSGLRDGIAANGLQIGVAQGGAVTVAGGVHVTGSLSATAYNGDATALHLLSGASVPLLQNSGSTTAVMNGETASGANAILVEAGGSLATLKNGGTISATVVGSSGSAAAIVDRAGSLTDLENTGTITATVTPASGSAIAVTGTRTAIDDSANTTGLRLLNYQSSGSAVAPTITGAIRLGSGDDSVDVEAGSITGDIIAFGAGANALTINGGATVTGALSADGGTLALSMGSGSLQINSANTIVLTSLNLGAGSKLMLTADPAAGKATQLDVTAGSGTATIADGTKLALRLTSIGSGAQTFTLIRANQLSAGAIDTSFLGSTPYLYNASVAATSGANGTVTLALSRKTAAELQLHSSIAGAYEPVIAAISGNPGLSQGLLTPTDRTGFTAAFNQLLPEHSGGIFQVVRAGVEAFGRPLDDRQAPEGGGAWVQEVNVGAYVQTRDALPGYKAWGVGLIGGFEAPATRVGVFGATIGGFSGELRPRESDPNDNSVANVVELGGYWRASVGQVALNARVAGDYLTATGRRVANFTSDGQTLFDATATGHWSGWGVTSRVRASYEARLGDSLYLRPQLGVDYLSLSEGAYTEGGGGAIDLAVDGRTTSELAGFAGLAVGAVFGEQGGSWGPELLLGYRDVVAKNDGTTTARFLSGGDSFTVGPNPISGGGGVARMALKSESSWGAVSIEGGAEVRDNLTVYDLKLAAHFLF